MSEFAPLRGQGIAHGETSSILCRMVTDSGVEFYQLQEELLAVDLKDQFALTGYTETDSTLESIPVQHADCTSSLTYQYLLEKPYSLVDVKASYHVNAFEERLDSISIVLRNTPRDTEPAEIEAVMTDGNQLEVSVTTTEGDVSRSVPTTQNALDILLKDLLVQANCDPRALEGKNTLQLTRLLIRQSEKRQQVFELEHTEDTGSPDMESVFFARVEQTVQTLGMQVPKRSAKVQVRSSQQVGAANLDGSYPRSILLLEFDTTTHPAKGSSGVKARVTAGMGAMDPQAHDIRARAHLIENTFQTYRQPEKFKAAILKGLGRLASVDLGFDTLTEF